MNLKVAIAGFGQAEGQSAYRYFAAKGADITIFDEREPRQVPANAKVIVGPDVFAHLQGFDVVVRTPSLRPDRIITDGQITSVAKEFFANCPAPVIGVTGSKGKSTTSKLIYQMLTSAGIRAHLVGNIGVSALDVLPQIKPDDVVVYELSSYQLWDVTQSPHIAVVLMMEPEHLDVHKNVDEYVQAKSHIAAYQKPTDLTIYLPGNALTEQAALVGKGQKIPYTKAPGAYVADGWIVIDRKRIIQVNDIPLPGQHNSDNTCAAVTAVWQYTQDIAAIASAIRHFEGIDHRLKLVREVNGVRYYDDSIATTPGSAIAALKTFTQAKIIILGGSDKGADFTELGQEVAKADMRGVIVIGDMAERIVASLRAAGFDQSKIYLLSGQPTMRHIVAKAQDIAGPGDVVILSPACASFGLFKNYQDRGDQFIAAVNAL